MNQRENGVSAAQLVGAVWQKSHHSNPTGNCVEVAALPDGEVAVRNSRYPDGPALIYSQAEISALILAIKDGDFDTLVQ